MDSLAKRFGASWAAGDDPPDAYLTLNGESIAVEVTTLSQHVRSPAHGRIPRRSYDAGVLAVVDEIDSQVRSIAPGDRSAVLTLRSPLLNLKKFKEELTKSMAAALEQDRDIRQSLDIAGNRVELTTHKYRRPSGKRVVGVVANRFSSADISLNAADILVDRIQVKAEKMQQVARAGPAWLALLNDYFLADVETYRRALRETSPSHPFARILLIGGDGRVDDLFGS